MNSSFDVYFGGIDSRATMQEKIRNMKTTGSVIAETILAVESRTPMQQILGRESLARSRQWTLVHQSRGTPYLGDVFVR